MILNANKTMETKTWAQIKKEFLKNKELAKAYKESEPEFELAKMVIAKSFESQRTGGFVYHIQKVERKGNTIFVDYTITTSGDIVTQAITNPLTVILVDKIENPNVEFELK